MNVQPYGDRAVLVDLDPDVDPAAASGRLRAAGLPGVGEVVPGAGTVLVHVGPGADLAAVRAQLSRAAVAETLDPGPVVELCVAYDGPDLAAVATAVAASTDDVIGWHTAPTYTVAFCGFTPGFGYLRGLDPRLHRPRLAAPRLRVPAGAVAIADRYSAVYPRPSPGGWHLLGSTDAVLWDLTRDPPALLTAGIRVRFIPR